MRNRMMGLFAALAMTFTTVGVSVTPTAAQAQSYRSGHHGYDRDRGRRYVPPRHAYRDYRKHRGHRAYRHHDRRHWDRKHYRGSRYYRNGPPRAYYAPRYRTPYRW